MHWCVAGRGLPLVVVVGSVAERHKSRATPPSVTPPPTPAGSGVTIGLWLSNHSSTDPGFNESLVNVTTLVLGVDGPSRAVTLTLTSLPDGESLRLLARGKRLV